MQFIHDLFAFLLTLLVVFLFFIRFIHTEIQIIYFYIILYFCLHFFFQVNKFLWKKKLLLNFLHIFELFILLFAWF